MKLAPVFCIFLVASASAFVANVQKSKPNGRIVGGDNIDIVQVPYQASVLRPNGSLCGGVVLNEFYVLTSAFCINGFAPRQLQVRAGTSYHDRFGQIVGVLYIYPHDNYNPDKALHDYDIAITRVSPSLLVGFVDPILPVALPPAGTLWGDDLIVTVTGWGETANGGSVPPYLQAIDVEVIPSLDCLGVYGPDFTDRMLCIGVEGGSNRVSPCKGDAGDPVVLKSSHEVVGIVSYERDNCLSPAVITNLADPEIRTFIEFYTGL